MNYAVVPSQGCYSDMTRNVAAIRVCRDKAAAVKLASAATRRYREAMSQHGGTSGGFRVVATAATSRRGAVWQFGHDLDQEPSIE